MAFVGKQRYFASSIRRRLSSNAIIFIIPPDDDDDDQKNMLDEYDDDDDEEEEEEVDPYEEKASSEFANNPDKSSSSLATRQNDLSTTSMDWGGALEMLRQRVDDVESGQSQQPSRALYRLMSSQPPNQLIGNFVTTANPQVVSAMGAAISSLLGGLSNPVMGIETVVKASGEKLGSLCFQLQMTGYMFRNAEYVLALKDLLKLRGTATLEDYKDAFDRLADDDGFIQASAVAELLDDVYDGKTPAFEIQTFLTFFDSDQDGRISWEEFKRGLGAAVLNKASSKTQLHLLTGYNDDEDDEDEEPAKVEPEISGVIEIEMEDGKVIEVEAKEYIRNLKKEAKALKDALRREKMGPETAAAPTPMNDFIPNNNNESASESFGGIAGYIAARQGDLDALTKGVSPEVVETMKMLVDFVMGGADTGKKPKNVKPEEMEMEIPASALQQLALWQLVLGYRLREAEAKGEYLRLLE